MKYLLILAAVITAANPRISIYPSVLFAEGTLHLKCSVPRHVDNRWLDLGVRDYRVSSKELAGDQAAVTHEMWIDRVPCFVGPAFCAVTDAAGKTRTVTAQFTMAGCEP